MAGTHWAARARGHAAGCPGQQRGLVCSCAWCLQKCGSFSGQPMRGKKETLNDWVTRWPGRNHDRRVSVPILHPHRVVARGVDSKKITISSWPQGKRARSKRGFLAPELDPPTRPQSSAVVRGSHRPPSGSFPGLAQSSPQVSLESSLELSALSALGSPSPALPGLSLSPPQLHVAQPWDCHGTVGVPEMVGGSESRQDTTGIHEKCREVLLISFMGPS